jgi:3-hydroxyisobutyrate dehydrogenase
MKAFLGIGLLGSNFVRAMAAKGEQVQVWNRTASKAKAVEGVHVKAFENVADAVRGAGQIHLALKDDASVNEVLAAARDGLAPGATIIDHTSTSVKGAIERTKSWNSLKFTYLHAPVFMGPQNALDSTGVMMVSGDQQIIARLEGELAKMTGRVMNFGSQEGKAAGMKLIGNLFLMSVTGGLSDSLALAKAVGVTTDDMLSLFNVWNPGASVTARIKRMTTGDYTKPSWELDMARKDARLMVEGAVGGGEELVVIPAVASLMDRWIAQGHGGSDWTVIAHDNIPGV